MLLAKEASIMLFTKLSLDHMHWCHLNFVSFADTCCGRSPYEVSFPDPWFGYGWCNTKRGGRTSCEGSKSLNCYARPSS